MEATFGVFINRWRRGTLHLPPIPYSWKFANAIVNCHVPFSAMWSPGFVPKPGDWPEQCRVVGAFTERRGDEDRKKGASLPAEDRDKFADLISWLGEGGDDVEKRPVFIGFGSMVIQDTESLQRIITDAARATGTRIVVQSSWSKMDVGGWEEGEEKLCHDVGPVSHDWLLPQCGGVIHHGKYFHKEPDLASIWPEGRIAGVQDPTGPGLVFS